LPYLLLPSVLFFFFPFLLRRPLRSTLFPYTTLFRSGCCSAGTRWPPASARRSPGKERPAPWCWRSWSASVSPAGGWSWTGGPARSEEHTSELQSRFDLVCRLLLEKKNHTHISDDHIA